MVKIGEEMSFGKLKFVFDKPITQTQRKGKQADKTYDEALKQLAGMFEREKGEHHVTLAIPDGIEGASFKSKIKSRIEKLKLSDKMHIEVSTKREEYIAKTGKNKGKEVKGTVVTEIRIHKGKRQKVAEEKTKE